VDAGEESAAGQRPTAGHSKPTCGTNAAAGLKNAVLFGLYPGAMPDELKELTYVELSMVAPVNSMTKLNLSGGKSYHQATQPTYTIMNNVNTIAKRLPRRLTSADIAILRTKKGDVPKDYTFRPYYVVRALLWLKRHNKYFQDIEIDIPVEWKTGVDGIYSRASFVVDSILLDESDAAAVESGQAVDNHADHSAHEAGGTAQDYLLMSEFDSSSNMDILEDALNDKADDNDDRPMTMNDIMELVVDRGGQGEFTDALKQEALLELSFPQFFPYGRGGPADLLSKWGTASRTSKIAKFANTALRGGGHYRRMQNNFNFLALCYYTCVRKRMAGNIVVINCSYQL
jgi:hypothetical protein